MGACRVPVALRQPERVEADVEVAMAAYATVAAALAGVDPAAPAWPEVVVAVAGGTLRVTVLLPEAEPVVHLDDVADRVARRGGQPGDRRREGDSEPDRGGAAVRVVVADDVMLVRSGLARLR